MKIQDYLTCAVQNIQKLLKHQNRWMVVTQVLVEVPRCAIVTPSERPGGPLGLFWWLQTNSWAQTMRRLVPSV